MIATVKNTVVVTDLDGTFLTSDGRATNENPNLPAIAEYKKYGGRFTVATGRYGSKFGELFPEYRETVNAPAIMCNGAYLMNCADDSVITDSYMPLARLQPLIDDITAMPYHLTMMVIVRENGDVRMCPPPELKQDKFYKSVVYGKREDLDRLAEFIREKYPDRFSYVKSCPTIFEIINPEATKGIAVRKLKEYYKSLGEDVIIIAAGDYENDLDMLAAADIAVCPSNALDKVKSVCKYILRSNNEGTIAHLIEKINQGEIEV
ncbi:MAG: HAD-IIB family hydrolase [Clostridia bacterium]|nr:HAD-IIB family hydrolase [Clostridia bacterium]